MAKKIADIKKMTHEEWLELRRSSIGGSDAASCVGMNPYSSLITLYADKKGLSNPIEDNESMRLGRDLEDYVAQRFTEETGKKVRADNFMYQDDEYEFITANLDRVVVGENAGLECKTMGNASSKYNFDEGEVPEHYYVQCQHYMMVRGFERMYLAILALQRGIKVVTIERNEDFIKSLREAEVSFWEEYIVPSKMPAPDGSDSSTDTLKELYPTSEDGKEVSIVGLDQMVVEYTVAADMEKHYKEEKDKIKNNICSQLEDAEYSVGEEYAVSWKTQKRADIDRTLLKKEMPEIYEKYLKVSENRVFRKKKIKK